MRDTSIVSIEDYGFALRQGYACPECEPRRFPNDELALLSVLRPLERDTAVMLRVRAIFAPYDGRVCWFEDEDVVGQIAHLIRVGELHICQLPKEERARIGSQPPASVAPPSPAPQSSGPQSSQPTQPTLPSNSSPGAQADALQNAAANGVPFCEICQAAGNAA